MICPFCGSQDTIVLETRETENGTRRRRECTKCKKRFTTYERIETNPLIIIKKNGVRQQFNKEKIREGIIKACEKRPISIDEINKICDKIERKLLYSGLQEIKSRKIGEMVMRELKKLDKIAYIRFASVYKEFKDIEELEKELKKIRGVKK